MRIPSWSALKGIGNSYPAKVAVLMPFIGYIIVFQKDVVQAISSYTIFSGLKSEEVSVGINIYMFYYGVFIFGLGSLIYAVFCHHVVKKYDDADAFCRIVAPTTSSDDAIELCNYVMKHDVSADRKKAFTIAASIEHGIQATIPSESTTMMLKAYYNLLDRRYRIARLFVVICFVSGLVLLAVPSAIVFVKVCKTI
ncbi:hypothetical protein [Methylocystis sp.]|uniref:hypothetical protein n=1 Tax=Methylocystis sp. TaxID=1911079 RepID=UPI003DA48EAF